MKLPSAATLKNASKPAGLALVSAAFLAWAILVVSCATTATNNRQIPIPAVPGSAPGATFVGSDQCAACHDKVAKNFDSATHSRLVAQGDNAKNAGCEACHGPGSKHVEAGGGKNTILNPKGSPEVCFQCHLDKRAEFRLTNSHPVMSGHMTCTDCHDPHSGDAVASNSAVIGGKGAITTGVNATCAKCHATQSQPHAFEHPALREGCVFCHNPHGSVNAKMLKVRSSVLCIQCHASTQLTGNLGGTSNNSVVQVHNHSQSQFANGVCWASGCHESVHGSNTNSHLRQ